MNRVMLRAGRRQWVFLQAEDNCFNYTHLKTFRIVAEELSLAGLYFKKPK